MSRNCTFPLERPHCGIPMSNGAFGILVWGKDSLNLTVNHTQFWDHRNGELLYEGCTYKDIVSYAKSHGCDHGLSRMIPHADWEADESRPQRVPAGRFELHFAQGIFPVTGELNYSTGCCRITLSSGHILTLCMALKQDLLLVEDPASEVTNVIPRPSWDFPKSRAFLSHFGFQPPEMLNDGWSIKCPNPQDLPFTFRCAKTAFGYAVFTGKNVPKYEPTLLKQQSERWWAAFQLKRTKIKTPDKFWNDFFDFSVYKLAAATIPFATRHGGLQGPWHEEYQNAQWCGDYHFNVNMQMIYSSLCQLGAPEHLLPLFNMLESPPYQEAMHHNAKMLFGVDDALHMTHALDDRGRQCGWISAGAALDPACEAWTALLYYDYWRYTGDREFLRERAYPFIRGVMRTYECMLDEDFSIPVAISAEYATSNMNMNTVAGKNPSYQLAAIRKLAKILLEISTVLKQPPKPIWSQILEKVPDFTTVMSYDSYSGNMEPRIAIWEKQDLEVCHRHHSHLGCIWPFDSLPEHPSPEIKQVLDNSIDHWIAMGFGQWSEWCIPWAAIIFSRMGLQEAPMQLFNIWKDIFLNEGWATTYLPKFRSLIAHRRHDIDKPKDENEVMQMDGTGGFISAFLDMCADTRYKQIRLFPGMPAKWKNVSFEQLHLPGGKMLSAKR